MSVGLNECMKRYKERLALLPASVTNSGNRVALSASKEITDGSFVVTLQGDMNAYLEAETCSTHANAKVKALYLDHEILLGAKVVPNQPGYHPVART